MNFTSSRRGFLRGGSLAAAAACISPAIPAFAGAKSKEPQPSPIRLGVASYSLRKFHPDQVIADLKQLRTPYLNVKDIHLPMGTADDVKREAATFRDAGITLTAAGTIYFTKDDDADMRPKFEYVKAAGIPIIVAGPTRETLARVEKFAREYDVKIAIHNHGPEDKQFPSPLDSLKAVQNMDPRMGVCLDVGHAARAGANVVDAIAQCGPRLFDVHMSSDIARRYASSGPSDFARSFSNALFALVSIKNNFMTGCCFSPALGSGRKPARISAVWV